MQKSGRWVFSFSHSQRSKDSSNHDAHKQEGSNFSRSSTCSRSHAWSASHPSQSPPRSLTRKFSTSFINCFNPSKRATREGANPKHYGVQAADVSSISGSKISMASTDSGSTFKYSGIKRASTDGTRPKETHLSMAEICRATGNFSQENVIGDGGFGTVYKGKLMDGSVVAVKRATKNKGISSEFRSEIETLSNIEHQNLVRFLGCLEDHEEQIIVTEYVGNGTLREHLDGTRGHDLELAQRLDIAIDVAHAITYLHTYTGSKISMASTDSGSTFKYSGIKRASTDGTRPKETHLSMAEICRATGNFSQENVIGDGGFGTVYKGKLMDGSVVAVKRATKNKGISSEFRSEIETLSNIEHQNLVRFLGCLEDHEEQIIVTEYVGNGTLREHLDGTRGHDLELAQRLDIAIDVAHAITYLHTYTDHPIIHRDIKASNILLTENLRAKVADFGFARLAAEDPDATHISTQIKGTAGYLDPEYIRTYQLTERSDVYSFGVLLIELITGRQPIERDHNLNKNRITTRWAMHKFLQGEAVIAMDQRLRRNPASIRAVDKVMALAYACLTSPRNSRPPMKRCAEVLWEIRRDFHTTQIAATAPRQAAG